jgi:hypothetical protein
VNCLKGRPIIKLSVTIAQASYHIGKYAPILVVNDYTS